jgi:hypothetical protein
VRAGAYPFLISFANDEPGKNPETFGLLGMLINQAPEPVPGLNMAPQRYAWTVHRRE